MTILYIDLETIPCQIEGVRQEYIDNVQPPGQYKKKESIEQWKKDNAESAGDAEWRKTSFDGTWGEIVVIGWAVDDGEIQSVSRETSEDDMINLFFSMIKNQLTRNDGLMDKPLWAAHNGCGFDFRFLWQRCVIRGIKPCIPIPYNSKPWEAVDTLFLWKGINKAGGSLDAICKAFGIPGKGDMDGSKVWDAVKEGRIKEVAEYCRDDVNKLRQIHKRMIAI